MADSPIKGANVKPISLTSPRPIQQWAIHQADKVEKTNLGATLEKLSQLASGQGGVGAGALLQKLLPKALQSVPQADNKPPQLSRRTVERDLRRLASIYADGRVEEAELVSLSNLAGRLDKVLDLEDAIGMLKRAEKQQLQEELFGPLRTLVDAAKKHSKMVLEGVDKRDRTALEEVLNSDATYSGVDIGKLQNVAWFSDSDRYQIGDRIRVPRSQGPDSLGIVVGRQAGAVLRVEMLTQDGTVAVKELSPRQVAESNILKIGDNFELSGNKFWVTGIDQDGDLVVVNQTGRQVNPGELVHILAAAVEGDMDKTLPPEFYVKDDPMVGRKSETRPIRIPGGLGDSKYIALEDITRPQTHHGLIAGNKETSDTVFKLKSPLAVAALHSDKGHNYKDWNEDGGVLFADGLGRLYVGVFDQAGGMGQDKDNKGAASAIAAKAMFDHSQKLAERKGPTAEAEQSLVEAVHEAHHAIQNRGHGEITTFVGAVIDGNEAVIVNVGDSGAMLFNPHGDHLKSTEAQGIGRYIFEGLGMQKDDGSLPKHDTYRWGVEKGQYMVLGSDGLLDAGLTQEEIGRIIHKAGDAIEATRQLRNIVKERMKNKEGKPDNLTIAVVRIE